MGDVYVVANPSSPVSLAIAQYYVAQRGIPSDHIILLPEGCPAAEYVTRPDFESYVRGPIEAWLAQRGLANAPLALVTTKGVPLAICEYTTSDDNRWQPWTYDRAAVDSELAAGWGPPLGGYVGNPYFEAGVPYDGVGGLRLVTRLTGYEFDEDGDLVPDSVERTIEGGLVPSPGGVWVLDEDPAKNGIFYGSYEPPNEWIQYADAALTALGHQVLHDDSTVFVSGVEGICGYASWGSNDDACYPPPYYYEGIPGWFLPGSLAVTYVSSNCRTFTWGPSGPAYGQSLLADLLQLGLTAGVGNVYEPFVAGLCRTHVTFPAYAQGYSLAESYYMGIPWVSWHTVVVGDPLQRIDRLRPQIKASMMRAGWNAVSFPVDPEGADAAEFLEGWTCLAGPLSLSLLTYDPTLGYRRYPQDFTRIEQGRGYWICVAEPKDERVEGARRTSHVIDARVGWQLVGNPFEKPIPWSAWRVVRDGVEMSLHQAVSAGLIAPQAYRIECGLYDAERIDEEGVCRPWVAYWLKVLASPIQFVVDYQ